LNPESAAYDISALTATIWTAVAKLWKVWYLCKEHDKIKRALQNHDITMAKHTIRFL